MWTLVIVMPGGQPMIEISKCATASRSAPRGVGSTVTVALPAHAPSDATAGLPLTPGPEWSVVTSTSALAAKPMLGDGDLLVGTVRDPQSVNSAAANVMATIGESHRGLT